MSQMPNSEVSSTGGYLRYVVSDVSPVLKTAAFRQVLPLWDIAQVTTMRQMYTTVKVVDVKYTFVQHSLIDSTRGPMPTGAIRMGLVPERINSTAYASTLALQKVPHLTTFPLAAQDPVVKTIVVSEQERTQGVGILDKLELDLASIPLKEGRPVLMVCNCGYSNTHYKGEEKSTSHELGRVYLDLTLDCSGAAFGA